MTEHEKLEALVDGFKKAMVDLDKVKLEDEGVALSVTETVKNKGMVPENVEKVTLKVDIKYKA